MTRRDIAWRAAGLVLCVGGCAAAVAGQDGSPLALLYFVAAILGLVLLVNGKRVSIVWKAERRGHYHTAAAVHARRLRRRDRTLNR